jgi:hypothetical protein
MDEIIMLTGGEILNSLSNTKDKLQQIKLKSFIKDRKRQVRRLTI